MSLVDDLEYRVAVQGRSNLIYVDDVIESLSWEERESELATRVTMGVLNERFGDKRLGQHLVNGATLRLFAGSNRPLDERVRGTIFQNADDYSAPYLHSVTAYDPLFYAMQSQDDRYFKAGKTGAEIIKALCRAWDIPTGEIKGPNEKLGKKMFRGLTIAEMFDRVLRDTKDRGGGRWVLRTTKGKLDVVRRGRNKTIWHFQQDSSLGASVDRSIEGLVTVVKIVGREKGGSKVLATATSELAKEYGHLQRIINRADFDTAKATKRAALNILEGEEGLEAKTRVLIAPDVPSMRKGDKCRVSAATMNGHYIASAVYHDPPSKTMTLELDTLTEEEIAIEFEETGLWDWIPPQQQQGTWEPFKGEANEALAISSGVLRGPQFVYDRTLPAARRAGGGFTITSWRRTSDSVDGPGVSWHYNGGRALDIVASPLSRLNALYVELRKDNPTELLWQVEDHYDHLHVAWESA